MSKRVLTKSLAVTDGYSGTITLPMSSDVESYIITPAVPCALGGAAIIAVSGTPKKGSLLHFILNSAITVGAFSFTVLGTIIGAKQMASGFDAFFEYNGSVWIPVVRQDFSKSAFIGGDKLAVDIVDNSTLEIATNVLQVKDLGITLPKLQNMAGEAKLLISDAAGVMQIVSLSGDITVSAAGVVTLGALSIDTADLAEKAVTVGKMADLAQGSLLIGNASARPVAISCSGAGYLLLGNGTTAVAVTLSSDVTIAASGAVTIANNAVTTAKILDGNVTLAKIASIGAAKIIVGNASGLPTAVALSGDATIDNAGALTVVAAAITAAKIANGAINADKLTISNPSTGLYQGLLSVKTLDATRLKALLDGTINDLFSIKAGEIVVAVHIYVQTIHGAPATCNVGVDASARSAGAVVDGLVKTADLAASAIYKSDNVTYWGTLQKFGFFTADANGNITIGSSIDCSSGALIAGAVMLYIAKGA